MATTTCIMCDRSIMYNEKQKERDVFEIDGKDFCEQCFPKQWEQRLSSIIITTTPFIDGYKVKKYIDIESAEIVLGTGIFSEFSSSISDFLGKRSKGFESKLQKAKKDAFTQLKYKAYQVGGNAIIGIDIDYTEFSGNRIGLIANGTIVEIEKI